MKTIIKKLTSLLTALAVALTLAVGVGVAAASPIAAYAASTININAPGDWAANISANTITLSDGDTLNINSGAGNPTADTLINVNGNAAINGDGSAYAYNNLRISVSSGKTLTINNLNLYYTGANALIVGPGNLVAEGDCSLTSASTINLSTIGNFSGTPDILVASGSKLTVDRKATNSPSTIYETSMTIFDVAAGGSLIANNTGGGSAISGSGGTIIKNGAGAMSVNANTNCLRLSVNAGNMTIASATSWPISMSTTGGTAVTSSIYVASGATLTATSGNNAAINYGATFLGALNITCDGTINASGSMGINWSSAQSVNIAGSGTVTATGGNGEGIYAKDFSVDGATVSAVNSSNTYYGLRLAGTSNALVKNGGTLNLTGKLAAFSGSGITMDPGTTVSLTNNSAAPESHNFTMSAPGCSWQLANTTPAGTSAASPLSVAVAAGQTGTVRLNPPVCAIGSTVYPTLDDALAVVAAGDTIKLLDDINYTGDITISGQNFDVDLGGYHLTATGAISLDNGSDVNFTNGDSMQALFIFADNNSQGAFPSLTLTGGDSVAANAGCSITVNGDITSNLIGAGVNAVNAYGGTITVNGNVTTTGNGIIAESGGKVTIGGSVTSDGTGIYADGAGSSVTVGGGVTVNGDGAFGVYALGGAQVTVSGGVTTSGDSSYNIDAQSGAQVTVNGAVTATGNKSWGAYANGTGTKVTANSGITATVIGADAENGAQISVDGSVTVNGDGSAGVIARTGGAAVKVTGAVTATGNSIPGVDDTIAVYTDGGTVAVGGNVAAAGAGAGGVYAENGAEVTVDGTVFGTTVYIEVDGVAKTAADKKAVTTKAGYDTYTGGISTVWVKNPVSAAAQAVIDAINALPNPVTTAADADKVAAAAAAYNALPAADKALIPQAVKDRLAAAQAQAAALSKAAPVTLIRSAQTTFYVVKGKSLTIPYVYDLAAGAASAAQPVFTWTSSDGKSVSVVSTTGKVKGLVAGKSAKVTVTADNGTSKTFTVKVVKAALKATGVSLSKPPKTIAVGASAILKAKIAPAKATGAVVKFSLDKASAKIVSVDKAGKVTALAKGTAKITVKAGGAKTVVTIKVK